MRMKTQRRQDGENFWLAVGCEQNGSEDRFAPDERSGTHSDQNHYARRKDQSRPNAAAVHREQRHQDDWIELQNHCQTEERTCDNQPFAVPRHSRGDNKGCNQRIVETVGKRHADDETIRRHRQQIDHEPAAGDGSVQCADQCGIRGEQHRYDCKLRREFPDRKQVCEQVVQRAVCVVRCPGIGLRQHQPPLLEVRDVVVLKPALDRKPDHRARPDRNDGPHQRAERTRASLTPHVGRNQMSAAARRRMKFGISVRIASRLSPQTRKNTARGWPASSTQPNSSGAMMPPMLKPVVTKPNTLPN